MNDHHHVAGQVLRQLRQHHRLTLATLADRTGISAAELSRHERGSDTPTRQHVQAIIAAYNLNSSAALGMWLAAGFLPDQLPPLPPGHDVYASVNHLLGNLGLPAVVLDLPGYLRAWTSSSAAVWPLEPPATAQYHLIDALLATTTREHLGTSWEPFAVAVLRIFANQALCIAGLPFLRHLLAALHARYGATLVQLWNCAHDPRYCPPTWADAASEVLITPPAAAPITYLVTHLALATTPAYSAIICVPAGSTSQAHYQAARAVAGADTIHWRLRERAYGEADPPEEQPL